jgi:hypothetical protein
MKQAQNESQIGKIHKRICFFDPPFVDHLHCGCLMDVSSASICAAATEILITFLPNGILLLSSV